MPIDHVFAVVSVSDIPAADAWYERLFGRPADNRPMDTLVEWRVLERAWLQVFRDVERAGSALVNFAVDDLATFVAELSARGCTVGPIEAADKGVALASICDPDGNRITFIGNFREKY